MKRNPADGPAKSAPEVVIDEWSIDSGELTPSLKLKRRVITRRYAALIDALYEDEATAHGG